MHKKKINNSLTKNFIQGLRPLSSTLPPQIKKVLKKNGFNLSSIVDNWTNIYEDMVKANSCIIVNKFEEIDIKMKELLNNNFEIEKIQKNALEFSNSSFFKKEQLFKDIEVFIN